MTEIKDFPIALVSLFSLDFGVRSISSFLKSKGYPTFIVSFQQQRIPYAVLENDYFDNPLLNHHICPPGDLRLLVKLLKDLKPKLIGLSVSSSTFRTVQIITAEIKKELNISVVWGGVHAIIAPEECISYADVVCLGEGEYPILELAQKLRQGEPLTKIPSLWIKKSNGEIEKNPLRPLVINLDELPCPDFLDRGNKFLIDSGKLIQDPPISSSSQRAVYPVVTSRGCLFSCHFCCNSVIKRNYEGLGPYLRRRSVKNVIEELRYVMENKWIAGIRFWDDVFTYDKEWVKEFAEVYIQEIGVPFTCYAHPKHTDKTVIHMLTKIGLGDVTVGIQSGSERINKNFMGRSQASSDIIGLTQLMHQENINPRFDLITDNPCENDEDNGESVELLLQLPRPYSILMFSLCHFPKTPLTSRLIAEGIIKAEDQEQYTSKAINNFFMFLPLSKNKKNLFWNCIKAMAVNKFFPKSWVRFCKKNRFFRKHPSSLYFLGRFYVLFINLVRFKILFKERRFFPFLPDLEPRFIPVENYTWLAKSKKISLIFHKELILFPSKKKERPTFCLKIEKHKKNIGRLHLLIEAHAFYVKKIRSRITWKIDVPGDLPKDKSLELELAYPYLWVRSEGIHQKISPCSDQLHGFDKETVYILKIKYLLPFGLSEQASRVLFRG